MAPQIFYRDLKSLGLKTFASYPRVDQFAVNENTIAIEDNETGTRTIRCSTQGTLLGLFCKPSMSWPTLNAFTTADRSTTRAPQSGRPTEPFAEFFAPVPWRKATRPRETPNNASIGYGLTVTA